MTRTLILVLFVTYIQISISQTCIPLENLMEQEESLSLVAEAITATQLNLKDIGSNVTLLLPINSALQNVLSQYGVSDIKQARDPFVLFGLNELLKYHIIPVPFTVDDLHNNMRMPTALKMDSPVCGDDKIDTDIRIEMDGNSVRFIDDKQVNSEAQLVDGDLEVCEGVVHIIDNVLNPCCSDATHDCDNTGLDQFTCTSHLQCMSGDFCSANSGDGCKACEECLFNVDAVDSDCTSRCGPKFPSCELDLINHQKACCARANFDFCT